MADRHRIVVSVERGEVTDVEFCSCCPGVTVEVRTYDSGDDPAGRKSSTSTHDGENETSDVSRDERGTYSTEYYEPDND